MAAFIIAFMSYCTGGLLFARYSEIITKIYLPNYVWRPSWGDNVGFSSRLSASENYRVFKVPRGVNLVMTRSTFSIQIQYRHVTDRQTDGRTLDRGIYHAKIASRVKTNCFIVFLRIQTLSSSAHEANNRRLKDRVTRSLSNLRLRPSARVSVAPAAGIDELSTGDTAVLTGDMCPAATASQSLSNSTGSDVDMCHLFTKTARSHSMLALNTDTS